MKRHHKQKWWSKASASANENVARWVRYESAVNYRSFSVVLDLNSQKVKFPEPNPTAHRKRLFSATATEWLWVSSRSRCATQGEEVLAAFLDLNSYVCKNSEPKVLGWHTVVYCYVVSCDYHGVIATVKANTYRLYIRCVVILGLPLLIQVCCPSIISQWLSLIKVTSTTLI